MNLKLNEFNFIPDFDEQTLSATNGRKQGQPQKNQFISAAFHRVFHCVPS